MTESKLPLAGLLGGALLAPATAAGSFLRRSRLFHPRGVVLRGVAVAAHTDSAAHRAVGERLAGPVLARFSGGFWKTHDWPDVLGCALRFRHDLNGQHARDDQDLLLATVRVPITTLFAPLSTDVSDYLDNDYFGVSPFVVPPLGRVKLRISPVRAAADGDSRNQRLKTQVDEAPIQLQLGVRELHADAPYRPVALLVLDQVADIDQEALSFDPFQTGRELEPVGFVHALRVFGYAASRWARGAPEPS